MLRRLRGPVQKRRLSWKLLGQPIGHLATPLVHLLRPLLRILRVRRRVGVLLRLAREIRAVLLGWPLGRDELRLLLVLLHPTPDAVVRRGLRLLLLYLNRVVLRLGKGRVLWGKLALLSLLRQMRRLVMQLLRLRRGVQRPCVDQLLRQRLLRRHRRLRVVRCRLHGGARHLREMRLRVPRRLPVNDLLRLRVRLLHLRRRLLVCGRSGLSPGLRRARKAVRLHGRELRRRPPLAAGRLRRSRYHPSTAVVHALLPRELRIRLRGRALRVRARHV